jgi:Mg-chelatase subunit ChlD
MRHDKTSLAGKHYTRNMDLKFYKQTDMNTKVSRLFKTVQMIFLGLMATLLSLQAVAQHQIDLDGAANQKITIKLDVGSNANATITDQNSGQNVFWNISAVFGGITKVPAVGFTKELTFAGLSFKLPAAAAEDNAVPQNSLATLTGTANAFGKFEFDLLLTTSDGVKSRTAKVEVLISKNLDVVLVLDRSGSMTEEASPGVIRWNALKKAALSLANEYQALQNRTNDQVRIVYFDGSPTPVSGCCGASAKKVEPTLPQVMNADFAGKDPNHGITAMGLAIKDAQTKLNSVSANATPVIVFFTDGEQNPVQIATNGQGFLDNPTGIPGKGQAKNVKIFTIGFEGTGGQSSLLQNMASHTGGTYHHSATGDDLETAFEDVFTSLLTNQSPQLIARSRNNVSNNGSQVTLQTFPLNDRVNKLMLKFEFGRNFETNQLIQTVARMRIEKDGVNMLQYARPSWAGNFTNVMLLTLDFITPPNQAPPVNSKGDWTVSISDSTLKFSSVNLSVIADDHRLAMTRSFGNGTPRVNQALPISLKLAWVARPIMNATVEAVVLRPGEDLGHELAVNTNNVSVSNAPDAGSPGTQKFNNLWKNDSSFRALFNRSENVVALNHTADGMYQGTFSGLTVAGTYKLIIRVTCTDSSAGKIQRMISESFYVGFSGVDMANSNISITPQNGQLVMIIRPITSYKKYIGPAMGHLFAVTNPNIQIANVVDHQDGRYTITFTGSINDTTTLVLADQPIFTGKLQDAGKGGGIIDKIKKWFDDNGIPFWLFWLFLLLLLILILWILFRRRKK